MARIARVVVPGTPHLVTQRGENNRQVFFSDEDRMEYLKLLAASCARWSVRVWAYCLMPDRVHLVVTPETPNGMARALGETHRRYAKGANIRGGREGKLWHARFASCALEPTWMAKAARWVERVPVEAGVASKPEEYKWSSAAAHIGRNSHDPAVTSEPPPGAEGKWAKYIVAPNVPEEIRALLASERTGRPLGSLEYVRELEKKFGRRFRPRKRGRKPKSGRREED